MSYSFISRYMRSKASVELLSIFNWYGYGMSEVCKGPFRTHSSAVVRFLCGTHVVISARNEVRTFHSYVPLSL